MRWSGTLKVLAAPFGALETSLFIYLAAMSKIDDHNEEHVVFDGVDNPVVSDPDPESWSTSQRPGCRWPWVGREEGNRSLDTGAGFRIQLAKCPRRGWPDLYAVGVQAQPSSALTSSQGMLGPSSAIAASKAVMSWASSNASISSS